MTFRPLDAALSVAQWGASSALAVVCVGLAVIVLGEKSFRPVAGALAAATAAAVVSMSVEKWWPNPPLPATILAASAVVGFAVLGLAAPMLGTVVTIVGGGWLLGDFIAARSPDAHRWAVFVGIIGSSFVASALAAAASRFVTAVVGGVCTALGLWAYVGASGLSAELFRVPVVWLALAAVLVVAAAGLEQARFRVALKAGDRRHAAALKKAREQKEKEDRERYERYMK